MPGLFTPWDPASIGNTNRKKDTGSVLAPDLPAL